MSIDQLADFKHFFWLTKNYKAPKNSKLLTRLNEVESIILEPSKRGKSFRKYLIKCEEKYRELKESGKTDFSIANFRLIQADIDSTQEEFEMPDLPNHSFSGMWNGEDYLVSLSTAKEMALLAPSERGFHMRLYFLDCEANLKKLAESERSEDE